MHDKRLYGTATVGTKGQIVIPSAAREEMSINTGDRLYVLGTPNKGMFMLLKEDKIEEFIDQMNVQVKLFNNFKKSQK
jgi:AbrB family looped-hinge helix DNA binding protein